MRIAVVIPVHNGAAFLPGCLDALLRQQPAPDAVIVIDNGSHDAGAALVARDYPTVTLMTTAEALGFAAACNRGIAHAGDADAVVILNQDTVVDPGWLAALCAPLCADPQLGIVGSLARFPDGSIQHAGGRLVPALWYGHNITATDAPDSATFAPPDYLAALATAYRGELLATIGGFDEGFWPAYYEDVDLALRARAAGWRIALAADATLVHFEGAHESPAHQRVSERQRIRLVLKHTHDDAAFAAWLHAEREHALHLARHGESWALRRAYRLALAALPELARDWSPRRRQRTCDALVELLERSREAERAWLGWRWHAR